MNKKIVLISFYNLDAIGIRTLHAILKKNGFDVHSIFFRSLQDNLGLRENTKINNQNIELLTDLIAQINPLFVGLSLNSIFFELASQVTKSLKAKTKSLIVWGGMHPTINPEICLKVADVVCIGEGDEAIVDLASKLSKEEDILSIANLYIKRGLEIIKNKPSCLVNDLDSLPWPDFSRENKYFIESGKINQLPADNKVLHYTCLTSRGCPFNCTYCYSPKLKDIYSGQKFVRRRSVDNVIDELKNIKKQFKNLNFIYFADDVFTMDYNWLNDFSDKYIKEINLPFFCYTHPKTVNEKNIGLLKKMGVGKINMGIQSGSQNIRANSFKRYDTNEEIIKAVKIIHQYGIPAIYDLIINNPVETEEDKSKSFDLFLKLPRPIFFDMRVLSHFPGTFLTNSFLEQHIISEDQLGHKLDLSFYDWKNFFNVMDSKQDVFWNCIFFFFNLNFMPTWLIVKIRQNNFLRQHPTNLLMFLRLIKLFNQFIGIIGIKIRKIIS